MPVTTAPLARERFGQNAAAAADIERHLALEATAALGDVPEAQRIDIVQRLEFAAGIPPVMGERAELGELLGIDVDAH